MQLRQDFVALQEYVQGLEQQVMELQQQVRNQSQSLQDSQKMWDGNFSLMEESVQEQLREFSRQPSTAVAATSPPPAPAKRESPAPHQAETPQRSNSGGLKVVSVAPKASPAPAPPSPPKKAAPEKSVITYSLIQRKPVPGESSGKSSSAQQQDEEETTTLEDLEPSDLVEEADLKPAPPAPSAVKAPTPPPKIEDNRPPFDPDLEESPNPVVLKRIAGAINFYNKGSIALVQRRHDEAIRVFEDFLKRFPNEMNAPKAQYWAGFSHFQLGQLDEAELAIRKMLRTYEHRPDTQGYKTSEGIYLLGKIHQQRDELEQARRYWKEVSRLYPGTTGAEQALLDLRRLGSN